LGEVGSPARAGRGSHPRRSFVGLAPRIGTCRPGHEAQDRRECRIQQWRWTAARGRWPQQRQIALSFFFLVGAEMHRDTAVRAAYGFFVAFTPSGDLLLCAKHLFVAATVPDHGARGVALFASQPRVADALSSIRCGFAADRVRLVTFPAALLDPCLLRAFQAAA
jgi:hypothetical protein